MFAMTRDELVNNNSVALNELIETAGGATHLAKMLGENIMVVKGWVDRDQISPKGAEKVEKHPTLGKKFKAVDLRPDKF